MTVHLVWQDPPPRKRVTGRQDWQPIAEALRSHPGRWARVYESAGTSTLSKRAQSVSQGIRSGNLTAFRPKGSFDAEYRTEGELARVYARYVGGAR